MHLQLQATALAAAHPDITITGSKSESNRLLLLQALYPSIAIANVSNSDDSVLMQKALTQDSPVVDIHHAGTAMRFLTAYFATQQDKEVVLTGSSRMQERPIAILVEALQALGAVISYEKKQGYPPIKIKGKKITRHKVSMQANVSSQYISALLLIGSTLENGLELTLEGKITSVPYIKMTLALLQDLGIETSFSGAVIKVSPLDKNTSLPTKMVVESDWSSASYFYSIIALSPIGASVTLSAYKANSLQGDAVLADIYTFFGVETTFLDNRITLTKKQEPQQQDLVLDLANAPDIAQTIAVTCFGLQKACTLTGLHTLKIKETDRLEALQVELTKLGAVICVTQDSLHLQAATAITPDVAIATYNDHRMAMAFAPLALKTSIIIENAQVVSKSYPDFWQDMRTLGFTTTNV